MVEVVFFEAVAMVAVVTSPATAGCSVVWRSVVVGVVWCSGVVEVMCNKCSTVAVVVVGVVWCV